MSDRNEVVLEGNLTRDPEMKYTNSGKAICRAGICWNYSRKVGDKYEKEPNFFDINAWGETAESLNTYRKGSPVHIEGSLKQESWDKEGVKHSKVSITVWKIEDAPWAKKDSKPQATTRPPNNGRPNTASFKDDIPGQPIDDSSIPF